MISLSFSFIVWAFITLSDGSPFLVVLMFLLVGIQAILTGQILGHESDVPETPRFASKEEPTGISSTTTHGDKYHE